MDNVTISPIDAEDTGDIVPYRNSSSSTPDALMDIWGGMRGRIVVVHTAWSPTRVKNIFAGRNIEPDTLDLIFNKIVENNNLLVEGDVIAIDHIVSQLRYLYNPENIRIENSWTFGDTVGELDRNSELIGLLKNRHIVCIGGPASNFVTHIVLREAKLDWLYDNENNSYRTQPSLSGKLGYYQDSTSLDACKILTDHGVFIKCDNPFNPQKRMYVLMGIHTYGTQGSAALACSTESASELISIRPYDETVNDRVRIHNLAWTRVVRKMRKNVAQFSPSLVTYRIAYPKRGDDRDWDEHKNPRSIRASQKTVKYSVTNPIVFLGARPSRLILHALFLILTMLSWIFVLSPKSDLFFYMFGLLFVFAAVGTICSFLWLLVASADRHLR